MKVPPSALGWMVMQHWDNALAVMDVCRRDVDRQRETILVHGEVDLDALDLLAAVEAALEATRRGTTGAAVDDDGAGFRSVAASLPPSLDQAVEQPAPHGSSEQTACTACRTGCRTAGQSRATACRKSRHTRSP